MQIYKRYHNLELICPECKSILKEWTNYGLLAEARLAGTVPYYCQDCAKKTKNYPIFNVTTRRNEIIFFVFLFTILGLAFLGGILL